VSWRELMVSPCGTHHLQASAAAYEARFDEVLKFHPPGLAPVRRDGRAWHVDMFGQPAYERRFWRTFGYYEGLAAVIADDGWHHIDSSGADAYSQRYDWCGNFQGGRCPVREREGEYLHVTCSGQPAYAERWRYAGDFRDGIGVVQASDGRSTHIDIDGRPLHGRWFVDLDVFHKGFARARDERGWVHVDRHGEPVYSRRFAAIEPFYNGQARVERFDGGLEAIDESGHQAVELRATSPGPSFVGGRLRGWPIGAVLHRGSNGAIFASADDSGRRAVIKSSSNLSAWAREAELLELLAGCGAPRLLDAFTRSGTGYVVLEHVEGNVLGGRARSEPRPVSLALRFVAELAKTLVHLHGAGWIHTDIHPHNVLAIGDRAFLLDYANAVRCGTDGRWHGEVHWGRWEMVPPEQFEGFTTLDRSADTYAMCALLAYLIQGHGPFVVEFERLRPQGWDAVREGFRQARARPQLDGLPESVRAIVRRGLAHDPAERFVDAAQLGRALEVIDG
jgi:hypothetical protein